MATVTPKGLHTYVGERGKTFQFTVHKSDGTIRDLTGATVTLVVEGVGTFACSIVDAGAGRANRVVLTDDYTVPAVYQARLVLDWTTPTVKTIKTELFEFEVRPAL